MLAARKCVCKAIKCAPICSVKCMMYVLVMNKQRTRFRTCEFIIFTATQKNLVSKSSTRRIENNE